MKLRSLFAIAAAGSLLAACDLSRTPAGTALRVMTGDLGRAETPRELSRAELEALPYAFIRVSRDENGPWAALGAAAAAETHVTYVTSDRRSVTLNGGAVSETHGLGAGLAGLRGGPATDPAASPTPVGSWPERIVRAYRFRDQFSMDSRLTVECRITPGSLERIEILGKAHQTRRMTERCRGPRAAFSNLYWADPRTGFIWKSRQWVGPGQPPIHVEVVTPFQP